MPTLKEKKRYIAYEILAATPLSRNIADVLLQSLSHTLGVFGMAEAGLLSISYDSESQRGIIRVSNNALRKVKAALLMTRYLGKKRVAIRTLTVSGVLKKAKQAL